MYQSEYLQISHTNRPLESMINIISWKCIWQFVDCIISQMHKCITLCFISSWLNQRTHHILTIHITSWTYIERGSDNITPHYKHIPHVVYVCINGIVHYVVLIQIQTCKSSTVTHQPILYTHIFLYLFHTTFSGVGRQYGDVANLANPSRNT